MYPLWHSYSIPWCYLRSRSLYNRVGIVVLITIYYVLRSLTLYFDYFSPFIFLLMPPHVLLPPHSPHHHWKHFNVLLTIARRMMEDSTVHMRGNVNK